MANDQDEVIILVKDLKNKVAAIAMKDNTKTFSFSAFKDAKCLYEKINKNKCDDYGVEFDSLKFYDWVKKQHCQVFFSSYEISDDSFYKVKLKSVMSLIGANTNGQFVNEYLYSNKEIKIKGE